MEYRNFFENLKFINIVIFFCEDRLNGNDNLITVIKVKIENNSQQIYSNHKTKNKNNNNKRNYDDNNNSDNIYKDRAKTESAQLKF